MHSTQGEGARQGPNRRTQREKGSKLFRPLRVVHNLGNTRKKKRGEQRRGKDVLRGDPKIVSQTFAEYKSEIRQTSEMGLSQTEGPGHLTERGRRPEDQSVEIARKKLSKGL